VYSEKSQSRGDYFSSTFVSNEEIERLIETLQTIKREQDRWTTTSKTTSKRTLTTQKDKYNVKDDRRAKISAYPS